MRIEPCCCASLGLALLVSACATPSAHLAGRVVAEGASIAGARVVVQESSGSSRIEVASERDGTYRFPPLRAGTYRLKATTADGSLVAFPGPWLLRLAPGASAWVGLQTVPNVVPSYVLLPDPASDFGTLSGVVRWEGKPVADAVVYLYLGEAEELKGPGFRQSMPTEADGLYSFEELPETEYYVAVRKRLDSSNPGPIREGDLHGVATSNPVRVKSGQEARVDLHLIRKEKGEDPNEGMLALKGTGARGRVLDEAGRPVAGAYVFAYRNRVIGHGMPDFVSRPTGKDGEFVIALGDGGLFYVGAREKTGGSPAPGERFGMYEGTPDHALQVSKGLVLEAVTIRVSRVLPP